MSLSWNDLVLNPVEWALDSCLEGSVFNVKTSCPTCEHLFNQCLINALHDLVYQYQDTVEFKLGWGLTPRYREEEIDWNGRDYVGFLKYPDVVELNVKETITTIVGSESFPISPYLLENATIQSSGSDFCVAIIPVDLVDDIDQLVFWNADTNVKIDTQKRAGYPRIVGDNWEIPLGKPPVPACESISGLNVQHCEYMVLEVELPETCTGDFLPVYPGTNNKIPIYKIDVLSGSTVRFWFWAWSLVRSGIKTTTDLEAGEFHKLYQSIEFRCFDQVEQLPTVTEFDYTCNNGGVIDIVTNQDIQIELLNSSGKVLVHSLKNCSCDGNITIKFKVYYRTDPTIAGRSLNVSKAKEAILYVVASELPVESCGCGVDIPFIAIAQTPFDNIRVNNFTGSEIISQQYGNSFGRKKYELKLKEILKVPKVVKL